MASLYQCHCCLLRPSARNLKKAHTRFGITETYLVMIEECFSIKLTSSRDRKCGICMVCVERLREACRFKLQVLLCQTKVQDMIERDLTLDGDVVLLSDDDMCDPVSLCEEPLTLPEVNACEEPTPCEEPLTLPEVSACEEPTPCGEESLLPAPVVVDEPTIHEERQSPIEIDRRNEQLLQGEVTIKSDVNEDRTAATTLDVDMTLDVDDDRTADMTTCVGEDRTADMTLDVREDRTADMTTDVGEDRAIDIKSEVDEDRPADDSNGNEDSRVDMPFDVNEDRTVDMTTDIGENRIADIKTEVDEDMPAGKESNGNEDSRVDMPLDVNEDRTAAVTTDVDEARTAVIKSEVDDDWPTGMSGGDKDRTAGVVVNVIRIHEDYEESLEEPLTSEELTIGEEHMSLSPDDASAPSTGSLSPCARQQLARPCAVRLERLGSDELPLATLSQPVTSHPEPQTSAEQVYLSTTNKTKHASPTSLSSSIHTRGTCETQFTVTSSSRHIQEHPTHPQLYMDMETNYCDLDNKQLASKPLLIKHNGTHELSKLNCGDCNGTFANSMVLKRHLKHHCPSKRALVRLEKSLSKGKPYKCKQCHKQFTLKWILDLHVKSEHVEVVDHDVEFLKKENIVTYERRNKREPTMLYSCNECNLQFCEKDSFETHRRAHTEEKPHVCVQCKNLFTSKAELERHFETHRKTRPEEKPHICEQCKNQFTSKTELERHKRIHSGDKSYECEICESIFFEESTLSEHLKTHMARRQSLLYDDIFGNKY